MKTLLLSIFTALTLGVWSQCQPDPSVTNIYQPIGALPSPAGGLLTPTNFFACPGQPFSQVVTAMAPEQMTVANPLGFPPTITVNINWIKVTSIQSLPAWVSYQCGGQLDPLDPCKMAYPTWSCVNAYANTPSGIVPANEVPGTIYSLDVIVDANVTVLGTQSNYNGGSISLYILDSLVNVLSVDPCNGGTISTNTTGGFNDPGAYVYTWSNGQQSPEISNLQNGWYVCTVLDQATGWTTTDSILVNGVQPLMTINDLSVSQPTNTNDGDISVSVNGGVAPYMYAWTGPNGFTASTASISNLYGGTYTLTVTDAAGCTSTKTYFLSALGLSHHSAEHLKLYPNPAHEVLTIKGIKGSDELVEVTAYTLDGSRLWSKTMLEKEGKVTIETKGWENGQYMLEIKQSEYRVYKPLIISHKE